MSRFHEHSERFIPAVCERRRNAKRRDLHRSGVYWFTAYRTLHRQLQARDVRPCNIITPGLFNSMEWNSIRQECIQVGCVPPAH